MHIIGECFTKITILIFLNFMFNSLCYFVIICEIYYWNYLVKAVSKWILHNFFHGVEEAEMKLRNKTLSSSIWHKMHDGGGASRHCGGSHETDGEDGAARFRPEEHLVREFTSSRWNDQVSWPGSEGDNWSQDPKESTKDIRPLEKSKPIKPMKGRETYILSNVLVGSDKAYKNSNSTN